VNPSATASDVERIIDNSWGIAVAAASINDAQMDPLFASLRFDQTDPAAMVEGRAAMGGFSIHPGNLKYEPGDGKVSLNVPIQRMLVYRRDEQTNSRVVPGIGENVNDQEVTRAMTIGDIGISNDETLTALDQSKCAARWNSRGAGDETPIAQRWHDISLTLRERWQETLPTGNVALPESVKRLQGTNLAVSLRISDTPDVDFVVEASSTDQLRISINAPAETQHLVALRSIDSPSVLAWRHAGAQQIELRQFETMGLAIGDLRRPLVRIQMPKDYEIKVDNVSKLTVSEALAFMGNVDEGGELAVYTGSLAVIQAGANSTVFVGVAPTEKTSKVAISATTAGATAPQIGVIECGTMKTEPTEFELTGTIQHRVHIASASRTFWDDKVQPTGRLYARSQGKPHWATLPRLPLEVLRLADETISLGNTAGMQMELDSRQIAEAFVKALTANRGELNPLAIPSPGPQVEPALASVDPDAINAVRRNPAIPFDII
jgi:hypothetical protein